MSNLQKELLDWTNSILSTLDCNKIVNITPLREQASLRSYFRLTTDMGTKVGVVSVPESNVNSTFEELSSSLLRNNIKVPRIEASNHRKGFMIVEDFGDKVLQLEMNLENQKEFYKEAINQIHKIQDIQPFQGLNILSEETLKQQMKLFEEWFLAGLLDLEYSDDEKSIVFEAYNFIAKECAQQPFVLCHFDFEFRNLMLTSDGSIGILDFQDLCVGPYTLDFVSILKDIENPLIDTDLSAYLKHCLVGLDSSEISIPSFEGLKRDIDFGGFQRQLRILGTLARLHLRDKKSFRLNDLIQTLKFLMDDTANYEELKGLSDFLKKKVEPKLLQTLKAVI
ncbi:MAG: aminoglycoside phosphotransferase family protein [Gammaproteobacteria bacterium]